MKHLIGFIFVFILLSGKVFAQFSTGNEKYDFTCGKGIFTCLQGESLNALIGKTLTFKHLRPEFVAVIFVLKQDGSVDMKNAKGSAGNATWKIDGEKINIDTAGWGKFTYVFLDINGTLFVASGAGINSAMLFPLHVQ